MQPLRTLPFNDQCVQELEKLLERAKQGHMNWFGYAFCEGPISGSNNFVGELGCFYAGHYGLQRCAKQVMERLDQMPAPLPTRDKPLSDRSRGASACQQTYRLSRICARRWAYSSSDRSPWPRN